jgi:two-component system, OmpR family, KDP operon response regulator KdpE
MIDPERSSARAPGGADGASSTNAESVEPLRILLVEDEQMNRTLMRAVLTRASDPRLRLAILLEAETLYVAREHLSSGTIDIMLLDVRLPDGSGLDLARELVGSGDDDRPRIVILSASVLPAERAAAMDVGCDAFLGKPYRPTDLLELLGLLAPVVDPAS